MSQSPFQYTYQSASLANRDTSPICIRQNQESDFQSPPPTSSQFVNYQISDYKNRNLCKSNGNYQQHTNTAQQLLRPSEVQIYQTTYKKEPLAVHFRGSSQAQNFSPIHSKHKIYVESCDNDVNQKTNHSSVDESDSFNSNSLNTTPLIRNSMRKIEADNSHNSQNDQSLNDSSHQHCELINHYGDGYHNQLNESVRKAIEKYKEYKNEISFTLQSQNSSRAYYDGQFDEMDQVNDISGIINKNETEIEHDSILRTPISHKSMYRSQHQEAREINHQIINNQNIQSKPQTFTYQNIHYSQQDNNIGKKPIHQVFEYNSKYNQQQTLKSLAPEKLDTVEPRYNQEELKDVKRNLYEIEFKNIDVKQPEYVPPTTYQRNYNYAPQYTSYSDYKPQTYQEIEPLREVYRDYDRKQPLDVILETPARRITNVNDKSLSKEKIGSIYINQEHSEIQNQKEENPISSRALSDAPTTLDSNRQFENIQVQTPPRASYLKEASIIPSPQQISTDSPHSTSSKDDGYKDLYRMIADLREKVNTQQKIIKEKEVEYEALQREKEQLNMQLDSQEDQIDLYARQDKIQRQIIEEKENEIQLLRLELQQSLEERDYLQRQLENLKVELKQEIKHTETERAKLKEMDEVMEVCKEQLHNFDSINVMSQQVIERLERQVGEYKFELDMAQTTIEKQHDMYYKLAQTIEYDTTQKSQQAAFQTPVQQQQLQTYVPVYQSSEPILEINRLEPLNNKVTEIGNQRYETYRRVNDGYQSQEQSQIKCEEIQNYDQFRTFERGPVERVELRETVQTLFFSSIQDQNQMVSSPTNQIRQANVYNYFEQPAIQTARRIPFNSDNSTINIGNNTCFDESSISQFQGKKSLQISQRMGGIESSALKKKLVASPLKNTANRLNKQRQQMLDQQWRVVEQQQLYHKENNLL
ncbi:UNKNOWN [Stylonychia lemnae]|uniref:Uncharacterized protein n=1 Tax=Stylonychia lemnae TaxID=5949 RepID=A0A078AX80_STYLE|nr:UNKNOWN [Stylonychia lemnae]|eukprot:CDW87060.1 UNKNOWN [Stylonychia lemnae]